MLGRELAIRNSCFATPASMLGSFRRDTRAEKNRGQDISLKPEFPLSKPFDTYRKWRLGRPNGMRSIYVWDYRFRYFSGQCGASPMARIDLTSACAVGHRHHVRQVGT